MRTYSHGLLTWAAVRRINRPDPTSAAWAALGAVVPDLPVLSGAAWLAARRLNLFSRKDFDTEVCSRSLFARPDAALHSTLPVAAALATYALSSPLQHPGNKALLPFLLGWAGHIATDTLTHGSDARPLLWPLSRWRFRSPVSYRERDLHALPFTIIEHALVLAAAVSLLTNKNR